MIYTTTIKGTNNPQSQEIIKNLDPREDLLFVYGDMTDGSPVEIQYIKPINDVTTIGLLDAELVNEITANHGEEIAIGIPKYELTFENGVYGITADIEVESVADDDDEIIDEEKKKTPLPILLAIGAATGVLTVLLVIIKMLNKKK